MILLLLILNHFAIALLLKKIVKEYKKNNLFPSNLWSIIKSQYFLNQTLKNP